MSFRKLLASALILSSLFLVIDLYFGLLIFRHSSQPEITSVAEKPIRANLRSQYGPQTTSELLGMIEHLIDTSAIDSESEGCFWLTRYGLGTAGRADPDQFRAHANDLLEIYNSAIIKDPPNCYRLDWSGRDSSGSKIIFIEPDSTRFVELIPSPLDGGPKIFERDVVAVSFRYRGENGLFVEVEPNPEMIKDGKEYSLWLHFDSAPGSNVWF